MYPKLCNQLFACVGLFEHFITSSSPTSVSRKPVRCSAPHAPPATMPTFASKPLNNSPLHTWLKRYPALFGVPFLLVMVGASFGLQTFTQTRYDLQSQKVTQVRRGVSYHTPPRLHHIHRLVQMSREQELGLDKDRKKFDVREEYFVSPFSPPIHAPLTSPPW